MSKLNILSDTYKNAKEIMTNDFVMSLVLNEHDQSQTLKGN